MKRNKGFTLIELLVVIGIVLVLAGILLPMINKAYRQGQITAQKLDFQAITTALENYRQDFNDYPRNVSLPTWNWNTGQPLPPAYMGLATALLGPGPVITSGSAGLAGDGADQFGFRSRCSTQSALLASTASAGATTLLLSSSVTITAPSFASITDSATGNDDEILITSALNTATASLTLVSGTLYTHAGGVSVVVKTPAGKVWGPYLQTDKYKVLYTHNAYTNVGYQPLLLDRWGTPIEYFTRFGNNTNRTGNSTLYGSSQTCTAGPLYGISSPKSNAVTGASLNGQNAIWDQNDGIFSVNTPGAPAPGVNETLAFKYMLGDDNCDNLINNSETSRFSGPFILISAGPDAKLCNFYRPSLDDPNRTTALTLPEEDKVMAASGNIYNFDR